MHSPLPQDGRFLPGMARRAARPLAALLVAASLAGCVPALMGGAVVGTAAVATDRRTTGIQLEDKAIDARIRNAVSDNFGDKVQVTPSSYNRNVLLVGTVPDQATRSRVARLAAAVENVSEVNDQLTVGSPHSLSAAANDSLISSQVRAAFLGTNGLASNAFVVTTHRNVVYLQGRVTRAEGDTGARVAAGLKGVGKVVKLFEYISEEQAQRTPSGVARSEGEGRANAAPAAQSGQPSSSVSGGPVSTSSGVQVIPIPRAP